MLAMSTEDATVSMTGINLPLCLFVHHGKRAIRWISSNMLKKFPPPGVL